jgi:hypothetical protein
MSPDAVSPPLAPSKTSVNIGHKSGSFCGDNRAKWKNQQGMKSAQVMTDCGPTYQKGIPSMIGYGWEPDSIPFQRFSRTLPGGAQDRVCRSGPAAVVIVLLERGHTMAQFVIDTHSSILTGSPTLRL